MCGARRGPLPGPRASRGQGRQLFRAYTGVHSGAALVTLQCRVALAGKAERRSYSRGLSCASEFALQKGFYCANFL